MNLLFAVRSLLSCTAAVLCALTIGTGAQAQTYPTKPVRVIVPYGPGGIADVTMRMVAQSMSQKFGQQFFIENRPGAAGVVGMQAGRDAPPDGYTLVMLGGGLTIAKALFKTLPYDIEKDFVPVSTTASYGLVITTKVGGAYKNIQDVITAAKAKPGKLNFGSINAGSAQNLSAELFKTLAGLDVTVVPYKTSPDLANAVLRGDVDVAFEYYAGFQASITNDQMVVLATTGPRARQQPAERADRERERSARLRSHKLERACGPRRYPRRDRHHAQPCGRRSAEVAGSAEIFRRRRHGCARHVIRRSACPYQERRRQMVAGHRQGRHREAIKEHRRVLKRKARAVIRS